MPSDCIRASSWLCCGSTCSLCSELLPDPDVGTWEYGWLRKENIFFIFFLSEESVLLSSGWVLRWNVAELTFWKALMCLKYPGTKQMLSSRFLLALFSCVLQLNVVLGFVLAGCTNSKPQKKRKTEREKHYTNKLRPVNTADLTFLQNTSFSLLTAENTNTGSLLLSKYQVFSCTSFALQSSRETISLK